MQRGLTGPSWPSKPQGCRAVSRGQLSWAQLSLGPISKEPGSGPKRRLGQGGGGRGGEGRLVSELSVNPAVPFDYPMTSGS